MISLRSVAATIDRAGEEYRGLWKSLAALKAATFTSSDLLDFQPCLARILQRLDRVRLDVLKERRQLVIRKAQTDPRWFAARLAALARYIDALGDAAQIGRSLGDSFAWFFVQGDRNKLHRHLEHPKTNQIPRGLGGEGEVRFIEKFKGLGHHFLLYHGITNFLRIGDVSLVSLRDLSVVALGEIKTTKASARFTEQVIHFVAPEGRPLPFFEELKRKTKHASPAQLPKTTYDRLRRQVRAMAKAVAVGPPGPQFRAIAHPYHSELESLLADLTHQRTVYRRCGQSLVLIGYRPRRAKLSTKLLYGGTANIGRDFKGLSLHAVSLGDPSKYPGAVDANSVRIGHLANSVIAGLVPMFWWPLNATTLEPLFFQDAYVYFAFNPARMVELLRSRGYTVTPSDNARRFAIGRTVGKYRMQCEGTEWFFALVPHYLLREETIVEMLESVTDRILSENPKRRVQININLVQYFERPPEDLGLDGAI